MMISYSKPCSKGGETLLSKRVCHLGMILATPERVIRSTYIRFNERVNGRASSAQYVGHGLPSGIPADADVVVSPSRAFNHARINQPLGRRLIFRVNSVQRFLYPFAAR